MEGRIVILIILIGKGTYEAVSSLDIDHSIWLVLMNINLVWSHIFIITAAVTAGASIIEALSVAPKYNGKAPSMAAMTFAGFHLSAARSRLRKVLYQKLLSYL